MHAWRLRLVGPKHLDGVPWELLGADQRLVAVLVQDPPKMIAAAPDQPPATRTLPPGGDLAATRWGDLVAVATDSGVLLMDPIDRRAPALVAPEGHPPAGGVSPSGHRIFTVRRTLPGPAAGTGRRSARRLRPPRRPRTAWAPRARSTFKCPRPRTSPGRAGWRSS